MTKKFLKKFINILMVEILVFKLFYLFILFFIEKLLFTVTFSFF